MTAMTVYARPHATLRGRQLPRSDTLFGALCWGIRLLFGTARLEQILRAFAEPPVPFALSSMYMYTQIGEKITHYLPKPLADPYVPPAFANSSPGVAELRALKNLNAMPTICATDFSDLLCGRKTDAHFYEACLARLTQAPPRDEPISRIAPVPHLSINRLTGAAGDASYFYTEEYRIQSQIPGQQSGLFFCLRCCTELLHEVKTAIAFLADTGIGGGRSSGHGHFTSLSIVDDLPYQEPPDDESTHVVTLSLTYPDNDLKKLLPRSWYQLERRQGKIDAMYAPIPDHARKDAVLMLSEGSTFPKNGRRQYGKNTIVRKAGNGLDFDVWQYGYAFTVNTRHVIA